MKRLVIGFLTALALTAAVGCGTTKNDKDSKTQNNQTGNGTDDRNSVADDGTGDHTNSVTNGTDSTAGGSAM